MRRVVVQPLTVEAFAPFGQVVSPGLKAGASANQGTAVRFDWSAHLVNDRPNARPNLCAFRCLARSLPVEIALMERHPHSSQAFLPLVVDAFLVCVAPNADDGGPDTQKLCAFLCGPGQGINYNPKQWHAPMLALNRTAEFAMLAWEDGSPADCEEHPLQEPILITAA